MGSLGAGDSGGFSRRREFSCFRRDVANLLQWLKISSEINHGSQRSSNNFTTFSKKRPKVFCDDSGDDYALLSFVFGRYLSVLALAMIVLTKNQLTPAQFRARYYKTTYKDEQGKSRRKYLMNFDGFSLQK